MKISLALASLALASLALAACGGAQHGAAGPAQVVEADSVPPLAKGFRYASTVHMEHDGEVIDRAYSVEVLDADGGDVTAFRVHVDRATTARGGGAATPDHTQGQTYRQDLQGTTHDDGSKVDGDEAIDFMIISVNSDFPLAWRSGLAGHRFAKGAVEPVHLGRAQLGLELDSVDATGLATFRMHAGEQVIGTLTLDATTLLPRAIVQSSAKNASTQTFTDPKSP